MKKFTTAEIRDLLNQVYREEISFSRMVEVLNEKVEVMLNEKMEDVSKPKFKKGDKVRIKDGISNKTHRHISPRFTPGMDYLIGKELTIDRYVMGIVHIKESRCKFNEDWLEPCV